MAPKAVVADILRADCGKATVTAVAARQPHRGDQQDHGASTCQNN